jgi:hypothetical protein
MVKRLALILGLLAVVTSATGAQEGAPAPNDAFRDAYNRSLAQATAANANLVATNDELYVQAVAAEMENARKRSDFEGYAALRAERERFLAEHQVPNRADPARTPALIANLWVQYRARRADTESSLARSHRVLTERYATLLEAVHRDLTAKGETARAAQVRAEIDRVMGTPAAQGGDAALAAKAPDEPEEQIIPCPLCDGTGKIPPPCDRCGSTGLCPGCGGEGKRPNPLRGTKGLITCLTCNGSGRCRFCTAPGVVQVTCTECKGSGKVRSLARVEDDPEPEAILPGPENPVPPPRPAPAYTPAERGDAVSRQFEEYRQRMESLQKQFVDGQVSEVDAAQVFAAPSAHLNKVLRSKVYLVSGFYRDVKVATTPLGGERRARSMLPYNHWVGRKAKKLSDTAGANAAVFVTYGYVNKDNITLFDIQRVEDVEAMKAQAAE